MNFKPSVAKLVSSKPERNNHINQLGLLGKVRWGLLIVAWILLIPFYGGWAIGIARGFPIISQNPPFLLIALSLFVICYGNRTAGLLVLTLMIPLGSQWILMDHFAPTQAIRIYKRLVESGLSADLEKEVLNRYIQTFERRVSRSRE